ncbi:MAG: hypothetical protein Fur0020_01980 [Thermodesulfovibrionia bacterium]
MDVIEAIKGRRSIRVYEDKEVTYDLIMKVIDAARWSPSATNRQAWKFIIIDDPDIRKKIMAETTAYFVGKAPVWILVLYSNRTDNIEYKDHLLSAAMSIQNMQLAAYSLGLGSCCVNNLPPKYKLRKILKIPRSYDPVSLVCIGYPKVIPKPLNRKEELDEIVCRDIFDFKNYEKGLPIKLYIKRIIRYIYYRLPSWLKSMLDPFARRFERRFDR